MLVTISLIALPKCNVNNVDITMQRRNRNRGPLFLVRLCSRKCSQFVDIRRTETNESFAIPATVVQINQSQLCIACRDIAKS